MKPPGAIYLDHHATTPLDPRVLEPMMPFFREQFWNPSSDHVYGVVVEQAVETARSQVAKAINAKPSEIFFTAGATESNNFVIKGVADHFREQRPHVITTCIEHKCILRACTYVRERGAKVTILPVSRDGIVSVSEIKNAIRENTVLVSVMHGNNEIGSINPITAIGALCRERGILFHTDAAQTFGKIPIDVEACHIDMLSASGHKFYGPKGVGFVFVNQAATSLITPLLHGGGQERGMRSGTLNVPAIIGLGESAKLAYDRLEQDFWHCLMLRDTLYKQLNARIPGMLLNGPAIEDIEPGTTFETAIKNLKRLPHNLHVTLTGVDVAAVRRRIKSKLAISSGSACSSTSLEPSYVLKAIGRTDTEASSSLRMGIGRFTTREEIDAAANILASAVHETLVSGSRM